MVDPNRKINRLTEDDIAFFDECEELFSNRFSESDDEFKAHCEKMGPEPPVVMNFSGDRGNNTSGQRRNHSYRGSYNDNRPHYRGGRGGGHRGYNRRDQPYNRRGGGGGGGGGDGRYRQNYRNYQNYSERNNEHAMNVRREYGKFVAASNSGHSPPYRRRREDDADNG